MYQRQVSSSPRSVPATRSSIEPVPPSTDEHQVVDRRGDRLLGHRRGVPGLEQRGRARRRGSSRCGRAAARCRRPTYSLPELAATANGSHWRPAYAGSENRCTPGGGDPLADPGAAAAPAVDRLALAGDPGAGVPVGVDHQVRHRASAAGSCRSGRRAGRPGARPSRAGGSSSASIASGSTSVKSRVAAPTQALRVRSADFAGAADVAGRLDVAQPQPGRRAEVRRGHLVVDEAVEHAALGAGAAGTPRRAPGRGRRTRGCRSAPAASSQSAETASRTRSFASSAGAAARAARSAASTSAVTPACVVTLPVIEPVATPSARADERDHGDVDAGASRRWSSACCWPSAGWRWCWSSDDHDAVVGRRGRERRARRRTAGRGVSSVTGLLGGVEDPDAAEQRRSGSRG